jgi:enamine deaminase RidA (YjgF/YER057c/UK114 family)
VVKTSTFIVAGHPIEEFMEARAEVFEQIYPNAQYPPNTILVVNRLVEERLLIEIEAVVAVPGGR